MKPLLCHVCKSNPRAKSHSYCYPCKRAYNAQNRSENVESRRKKKREYYYKNLEKARAWRKRTYYKNRERILANNKVYRSKNAERIKARHREYAARTAEKRRWYNLQRKYKIGREDFERLYKLQNGLCAICKVRPSECVDHDHKTNKVRGLLCNRCNLAVGLLADNADIIERARKYLCH